MLDNNHILRCQILAYPIDSNSLLDRILPKCSPSKNQAQCGCKAGKKSQCNKSAKGYSGGNLACLLTSHASPAQQAEDYGKPSPFFNIFHTLELGAFTDTEARELIASSPQPFAPADVAWILDQSGRWPSLLQILCQIRLAALEEGRTDNTWQTEGLQQMKPFRYLLE